MRLTFGIGQYPPVSFHESPRRICMNRTKFIATGDSHGVGGVSIKAFFDPTITSQLYLVTFQSSSPPRMRTDTQNWRQYRRGRYRKTCGKCRREAVLRYRRIAEQCPHIPYQAIIGHTTNDLAVLWKTSMKDFISVTQVAFCQILVHGSDGSVVRITTFPPLNPIVGGNLSTSMISKNCIDDVMRTPAMECAEAVIGFDAFVRGTIGMPCHKTIQRIFQNPIIHGNSLISSGNRYFHRLSY